MKKQSTIIVLSLAILVSLGSFAYFKMSKISVDNTLNTNEIVNNVIESNKIDTSDWLIFEDEVLGIRYKHPEDCSWQGAGPGTNYTAAVTCLDSLMEYNELGYGDLSIEEISYKHYRVNKEDDNDNIPADRFLSEVKKIEINNYEVYEFIIDWGFVKPCGENYLKHCEGGLVDNKTRKIFISDEDRKMLISMRHNDLIGDAILSTFEFIK